jgi:excisionase family DNA binding protein
MRAQRCQPTAAGAALKFVVVSADRVTAMTEAESARTMEPQTVDSSSDGATESYGEILTVTDVARFLRVPKSTVYKLARLGELPASKIGKHWRFLRRDIHDWLRARSQHN